MKKLVLIVAAVIGLLLVVAVALPFVIDADNFRPTIEEKLSAALARKVSIGHLVLSIWRGELKADELSIADDPAFSSAPFFKAKSFGVGVDLVPLVLSHTLHVRSLNFVEPEILLLRAASGRWNFSSLGESGKQAPATAQKVTSAASGSTPLTVDKLEITNGRLTIGSSPRSKETYEAVNITATHVTPDSSFPFTLDARTPGGGGLQLEGEAGPVDASDAAKTPFHAKMNLKQVDLAATGLLDPSSGIAGTVSYQGELRSDGKVAHSDGTATVEKMRLVKAGSPAGQPISIRYASDYDLVKQSGQLTKGELVTGKSTVALSGTYDTHTDSTLVHMKLDAPSVPVEDIKALLPAVGVTLPAGASLQGGTAAAHLALDGPIDKLVTAGDVKLSNAKLTGFGLASQLAALSLFTGVKSSPDTLIQTMASNLKISPEGIQAEGFQLIVPELGTITGAGTIGDNGALNFKLLANLSQAGVGGALAGLVGRTGLGASLGNATSKGIPFLVQGTSSNPRFVPDTNAMIRGAMPTQGGGTTQPATVGNILQGIFGKKKQ
jgi:AsmA protein